MELEDGKGIGVTAGSSSSTANKVEFGGNFENLKGIEYLDEYLDSKKKECLFELFKLFVLFVLFVFILILYLHYIPISIFTFYFIAIISLPHEIQRNLTLIRECDFKVQGIF